MDKFYYVLGSLREISTITKRDSLLQAKSIFYSLHPEITQEQHDYLDWLIEKQCGVAHYEVFIFHPFYYFYLLFIFIYFLFFNILLINFCFFFSFNKFN